MSKRPSQYGISLASRSIVREIGSFPKEVFRLCTILEE